ncbi:MAG: TLC domain-containing protein, partial [Cytophagales bacterium]|nr:TLC domain-containing protein [Cytophagales bacterium]
SPIVDKGLLSIPLMAGLAFQAIHSLSNWRLAPGAKRDNVTAPLIHALVTSLPANYLYFSRKDPGWLRVIRNDPPKTELETVLPLITMGYAGYEMLDSLLQKEWIYVFHSGGILAVAGLFASTGRLHLLSDTLMMETSSIFYNLRRVNTNFLYGFAAAFFFYRWGVIPYEWFQLMKAAYYDGMRYPDDQIMTPAVLAGGLLFNGLNFFWGMKILKILSGGEKRP